MANLRPNKGNSILSFPDNFVVLDVETTGTYPQYDYIIEISALRVRACQVVNTFSSLVKPFKKIPKKITELTGITNEMVENAPTQDEVIPAIYDFIKDDIIVGHNINFDINFLYDAAEGVINKSLNNDFVDTLRISRKYFPNLEHHTLRDTSEALQISAETEHRALADCQTTFDCFMEFRKRISSTTGINNFISGGNHKSKPAAKRKYVQYVDAKTITADTTDFDENHPLYGKKCVFTGELERMTRLEAVKAVLNSGGTCDNNITKKTDYLIEGSYASKTGNQKKAEEYISQGVNIKIISEAEFYNMLGDKAPAPIIKPTASDVEKTSKTSEPMQPPEKPAPQKRKIGCLIAILAAVITCVVLAIIFSNIFMRYFLLS